MGYIVLYEIFRSINKLKNGDMVYVTYNGRLYAYAISGRQTVFRQGLRRSISRMAAAKN